MGERAFSLYDMEEFLREAGAERVTEDAVLNLEKELEKLTESVANRALRYAAHAGRRKLINKNDVMLTRSSSNYTGLGSNRRSITSYRKPSALRRRPSITNPVSIRQR
ncbi:DNA-binding protein HMf-1 [uncultured archaeon]|nr:DNA-binding protein HMf-1 [uncultured archaeon]